MENAKAILSFMKSWHNIQTVTSKDNRDEIFEQGWDEIRPHLKDDLEIKALSSFIKTTDPTLQPSKLTTMWMDQRIILRDEIDAQIKKEEFEATKKAVRETKLEMDRKTLLLEETTNVLEQEISKLYSATEKKAVLVKKIDEDIHPTVLDPTTLLNKRNLLITSSTILIIALIADGDLSNLQILGIKAGEMNGRGLWVAMLAGLIYLAAYYIFRIRHYSSMIENNKSSIENIDSEIDNIILSREKISNLNEKANKLKSLLNITSKNNHEPIMRDEDDIPDTANPFKMNSSKNRIFGIFDITIPALLTIAAFLTCFYQIWVYEPKAQSTTEQINCDTLPCPKEGATDNND